MTLGRCLHRLGRTRGPSVGVRPARHALPSALAVRRLSTGGATGGSDRPPSAHAFVPQPPAEVTLPVARGVQEANRLVLEHGVGRQRLQALAREQNLPVTLKWQRMMEVFLGSQLHVLASLGYQPNDQGIMLYSQHLAAFMAASDPDTQQTFRVNGQRTWRSMLAVTFQLHEIIAQNGPDNELSIVDARNMMHRVSSRLIEPDVLEQVADRCSRIQQTGGDKDREMSMKHQVIQDVVVNSVYLGGSPSLVEELGFGTGEKGYAYMQYRMAFHENDPLCMQYTSSAMMKIWQAAGLDFGQGQTAAAKMPMSAPMA